MDDKLLSALTPNDRKTIEGVMTTYPKLTTAEAIEITADFGGLEISSPDARELIAKFS